MDTPEDEQSLFSHITCSISAKVNEVNTPDALALDLIEQVKPIKISALTFYLLLFLTFTG